MFRLWLLLVLAASVASTAQADIVRLANGEWKPYMSADLKHYGVVSYIVREAFKLEGDQVKYQFLPWMQGFEEARQGRLDGSVVWSKTAQRSNDFYFSDPVIQLNQVLFHRVGETIRWTHLKDLGRYRFGGVIGYHYALDPLIREGVIRMSRVPSEQANYKKLQDKRIDLIVENEDVGQAMIHQLGLTGKIQASNKPLRQVDYHLIISKKNPQGSALVERFNKGLAKLKASGRYQKLLEQNRQGFFK
ncbi:substrate-binding periplasmic protein [Dongshaea marina]|uniref:substrate-binding periplasmic protein n=1 Tax=Dongshaea marina TaxID=2047966 RepID=UPI000D3E34DB|nr:transporter substrate-binding domain-containing protein [Dongshaea marina]